ncbi:hypothetical protein ILUMI_12100 [Ignelater luminosus]|uniref:Uncharacterized protein n=1 Tax=Ignelater luminosus TaxID=2038154 RepID=A0A8K0GC44_IGNLU|nr:hypothetical protein ILUMI_12100 [Ignelater luminosus]
MESKRLIMKNKKKLKGSEYYIDDDLTDAEPKIQKKLSEIGKIEKNKAENNHCRLPEAKAERRQKNDKTKESKIDRQRNDKIENDNRNNTKRRNVQEKRALLCCSIQEKRQGRITIVEPQLDPLSELSVCFTKLEELAGYVEEFDNGNADNEFKRINLQFHCKIAKLTKSWMIQILFYRNLFLLRISQIPEQVLYIEP